MANLKSLFKDTSVPEHLSLSTEIHKDLVQHVIEGIPREVCGIISGRSSVASTLYPIKNVSSQPAVAFLADKDEMAHALNTIASSNEQWLATYHSHPPGASTSLSPTDINAALGHPWVKVHLLCVPTLDPNPTVEFYAYSVHRNEILQIPITINMT